MILKPTFSAIILSIFSFSAFSQQTKIEIVSSSPEETVFKVKVKGFDWNTVETPQGKAKIILVEDGTPISKIGAPNLAKLTASVVNPEGLKMKVKATVISYTDFYGYQVAPTANSNASFIYGAEYSADEFYPAVNAEMGTTSAITINPVQYNPATQILRLANEIMVTVSIDETISGMNLYPNPTSGLMNVSYVLQEQTEVNLDVYNTTGQLVYSSSFESQAGLQTVALDATSLATGVYSLALNTEKGTLVKRLVIE